MQILHRTSLKPYNTFGIDAKADQLVILETESDYPAFVQSRQTADDPLYVLGGGSNVVLVGDYHGTLVHPANKGIRLLEQHDDALLVEAAAGEVWDDFVWYCIQQGWHGLENLAHIPGTVGASAVQNVGAYGREAKDVIAYVYAYDLQTSQQQRFDAQDCQFGYRHSFFKQHPGRYLISNVVFRLQRKYVPLLNYKALTAALEAEGILHPTARQMAETVTAVRDSKLPDPKQIGSAGSFFKNPVVTASQYEEILERYPKLVAYPLDDGRYKLAAGWLIEQAGWKGRGIGRVAVYDKQALVLVNRGECTGQEVVTLANAIIADVDDKFGVILQPEAIFVP